MFNDIQNSLFYLINLFNENNRISDSEYKVKLTEIDKIPLKHLAYISEEFILEIVLNEDYAICNYNGEK